MARAPAAEPAAADEAPLEAPLTADEAFEAPLEAAPEALDMADERTDEAEATAPEAEVWADEASSVADEEASAAESEADEAAASVCEPVAAPAPSEAEAEPWPAQRVLWRAWAAEAWSGHCLGHVRSSSTRLTSATHWLMQSRAPWTNCCDEQMQAKSVMPEQPEAVAPVVAHWRMQGLMVLGSSLKAESAADHHDSDEATRVDGGGGMVDLAGRHWCGCSGRARQAGRRAFRCDGRDALPAISRWPLGHSDQ